MSRAFTSGAFEENVGVLIRSHIAQDYILAKVLNSSSDPFDQPSICSWRASRAKFSTRQKGFLLGFGRVVFV